MAEQGLFGPSPWEIQQAQQQSLGQNAADYARMNAAERSVSGMYQAGGMLGGMGAEALGMKNVAVENAKRTEQIMGDGDEDLGTSAGMAAKAEQFRKVGDLRTATALTMKANEMKRQEATAALAARKQDYVEKDAMDFKRDQLLQQAELKKAELEQRAKDAQLRSDDARYNADQRRAAAAEAAQTRAMIAALTAETRKATTGAGGEKPLTADQRLKWERKKGEDIGILQGVETELKSMISQAQELVNHPGLPAATGISGYLPSRPSGDAAKAEALLEEFKASTSGAGLEKVRMGGGIGAMTVQEWPLVEKMIANIDPKKLGLEGTKAAINKVIAKMTAMSLVAKKRYEAIHGESAPGEMDGVSDDKPPPPGGGGAPAPGSAADRKFKVLGRE